MRPKTIFKLHPVTFQKVEEKGYFSIRAAARANGISRESIRKVINKENRTSMGYKWATADYIEKRQSGDLPIQTGAKILLLDIETAPLEAYVWGMWKQNIYLSQLISNWYILTWAAKWIYDSKVLSDKLTPEEALDEDDERVCQSLWKLLDEADIVIAHNGDKYDLSRIRSRFLVHDMLPPSFYKQIDTLKIARKEFDFPRNDLNSLAAVFEFEGKSNTTFELWSRCKSGDSEALREMEKYNIQDIFVLEDVYLKIRPWIKGHPNLDLYIDSPKASCPHCGNTAIKSESGFVYTQAVRYVMFRCVGCGAISRGKKGIKYNNKKQISAIPR